MAKLSFWMNFLLNIFMALGFHILFGDYETGWCKELHDWTLMKTISLIGFSDVDSFTACHVFSWKALATSFCRIFVLIILFFIFIIRSVLCWLMVGSLEDHMGMLWATYALKHRYLIFICLGVYFMLNGIISVVH